MTTDNRVEPTTTVMADGSTPHYKMCSADNAQTLYPVYTVYLTGTSPDPEVSVVSAAYGDAIKTEADLYLIEIPASHPSFPKMFDKDTAFVAEQDMFNCVEFETEHIYWVRTSNITIDEGAIVIPDAGGAGGGIWAAPVGTTTVDVNMVHYGKVVGKYAGKNYIRIKYMGRGDFDNSA